MVNGEFPNNEPDHGNNREHRQPYDEAGIKPVLFLPLIQNQLEAREEDSHQSETNVVDATAFGPFEVWRVFDKPHRHQDRENTNRNVDVEDPAPGIIVGNPTAQRWANDW